MTVKQDNWAERYQNSDHHSDRTAYNKVRYEDTTGWDFPEPAPLDRTRMARGRGGSYDQGVVTITRRRQLSLEPELDFALPHSRTAQRITNFAANDADVLSHNSRSRDRQLLNDITTRLHRVEFDGVKPDFDVAMKTGFRRKMYHKKFPPLEKETREAMRKDILRYPWDHTQDNLYRPIKHKKECLKRSEEKAKKETLKSYHDIIREPPTKSPYPVYDPMGVYTKRPKRQHKELPELKNKYDTMNIREKLATVRAKVQSMPRARDASRDVDTVLEDLCRPLPKSLVAGTDMYTVDDYYAIDENERFQGLDSHISGKIKASHGDLNEFDRMLTERFGTKKRLEFCDILGRKRGIPPPPPPQYYNYDEEQVNTPYADQYTMKPPLPPLSRQPSVRRHVPRRLPESALFIRAGSLPPSSSSRIDFYEDDLPPTPRVPIKRQVFTQSRPVYRTMSEPPPTYRPFYRAASEPPPYRPSAYETYEPIYRSSSIYDYDSEPLYRPRSYSYGRESLYRPRIYDYDSEPLYRPRIYSYGRESLYRPRIYDYDSEPLYRPRIYDYASEPAYRSPYYPSSIYQATPYIYRPAADRPTTDPRNRYTRVTPYSQIAVRNAKRYMDKIERELGMHENGPIIAEPVVIHHLHQGAPRVVPRASPRVATVSSPRYRSSSLPPLSRGVPRSSRIADIEARLERDCEDYTLSPISPQPESLSALRTRAVNIKNKMDTHKSMMDRYLPVYLGPENEVVYEVDYKYGELVNRMPSLDRHRPFQGSTTPTPVAPYRPASKSSKPPLGNSYGASARPVTNSRVGISKPKANFRPQVSETRKRIREVMCATKKDPHYYD